MEGADALDTAEDLIELLAIYTQLLHHNGFAFACEEGEHLAVLVFGAEQLAEDLEALAVAFLPFLEVFAVLVFCEDE